MNPGTASDPALRAVIDALTGQPVAQAAARAGISPAILAAAAEAAEHAIHRVLEPRKTETTGWEQYYLHFSDWRAAERTAAECLAPLLEKSEQEQAITSWWFIRKHPCWRLRIQPAPGHDQTITGLRALFDDLHVDGKLDGWWPGIYEPETAAFGGITGMAAAHDLFHADSHHVLAYAATAEPPIARRELSILLCSTLLRGAGLEWYEQGDVWDRIRQDRPLSPAVGRERVAAASRDLRHLLVADISPTGPFLRLERKARFAASWAEAFYAAGQILGVATRTGTLQRGLREILSYHVIFHWNRLGLTARTQSILATAARTTILGPAQ
jgi:thiopeptide-type bacteriocin biosynthesis protein